MRLRIFKLTFSFLAILFGDKAIACDCDSIVTIFFRPSSPPPPPVNVPPMSACEWVSVFPAGVSFVVLSVPIQVTKTINKKR
jgi:hypothetical protein